MERTAADLGGLRLLGGEAATRDQPRAPRHERPSQCRRIIDASGPAIVGVVVLAIHNQVCGEMAASPDLALAFVALGADALSVAPALIPELKQAFASATLGLIIDHMNAVLRSPDGPTLQAALRGLCGQG